MIVDLLYCELARLALYHLLIPHGDRQIFALIRWLFYTQYPDGWLLYPLPLHLSYLPIPPLIVVYYIAILRHRICHHIPLLHICWLLICYFDTCILIINPYSIHNNYLSSCKIAKLQLQNVSSLLHHFDKLLQCGQPHHNSILVVGPSHTIHNWFRRATWPLQRSGG